MHETLVTLPEPVPPVTAVRGTLVVSSQGVMREHGLEERYWAAVDPAHERALREVIAASWVPIEVGLAHYRAMDALGFSRQQAFEIGVKVIQKTNQSFIGTLARSLRITGSVSPLIVLNRADRIVGRLVEGGGVAAYQLGPKEARLEMHDNPLASIAYCIEGWRGLIEGALELVAKRVFVSQKPTPPGADILAYGISWV